MIIVKLETMNYIFYIADVFSPVFYMTYSHTLSTYTYSWLLVSLSFTFVRIFVVYITVLIVIFIVELKNVPEVSTSDKKHKIANGRRTGT